MILGIQFTPVLPPPDVLAQMGWRIGIAIVVAFLVQRALFLIWGRLPGLLARAAPEHAQAHATQRGETIKYILRNVTTVTLLVVVVIRALEICREAARTMSEDSNWAPSLLEPIVVLGIERLAADGAVMRLVLRTRPGEEGSAAARELRRRVHDALAAGGIEYPATAISVASPNAGPTPQT